MGAAADDDADDDARRAARRVAHLAATTSAAPAAPARRTVVVFGGCVMDIHARATRRAPRAGTTTIGTVTGGCGGVGYNIAHGLRAVRRAYAREDGASDGDVCFVSAVGDDASGAAFVDAWANDDGDSTSIVVVRDARTATVVCVLDDGGEIVSAVADVECVERGVTPDVVRASADVIEKRASFVVVDANLSVDAIRAVCEMCSRHHEVKMWYEPVSVEKAARIVDAVGGARPMSSVEIASPNAAELRELANAIRRTWAKGSPMSPCPFNPSFEFESASEALDAMASDVSTVLAAGCACVVLTLGALGCVVSRASPDGNISLATHVHIPAAPVREIVSLIGAGDALVAASVAALASGVALVPALARGVACAAIACEHPAAPLPPLDVRDIDARARAVRAACATLAPAVPQ